MAVGWYLLDSGQPFYGTLPPGVTDLGAPPGAVPLPYDARGDLPEGIEDLAPQPALIKWHQKLAAARSGGLSAQLIIIGDSRAEGYTVTRYRNRWIDRLRRRFQGATPGSMGFLPASANAFSTLLDADWAGGDNPWTYSGVTGSVAAGLGFHGASCTAGSITLTYFGDVVQFYYQRTTGGPAAAAVTLDGVAQTALNAQGSFLPGQIASYGAAGAYGFHTLVITVSSGTLIFEGAIWHEGGFNGFTANGDVMVMDATHAGFNASNWAGSTDWSGAFASVVENPYPALVMVCLDTNDVAAGRTPAQFEDDLVTIAAQLDARFLSADTGYLFVFLPASNGLPMVDAAWRAAARIGSGRAGVYDLAQLRPGRTFGPDLSTDGSHPNDAGNVWVAEALGALLDPFPASRNPVTPTRQVIDHSTPPTFRSSWAESLGGTGFGTYDASPAAAAVSERRHRVWLDPGTYRVTAYFDHFASGNTAATVLLGRYAGNTPTLTSCGTADTTVGTGTTRTRLPTSIVNDVAVWVPLVIRQPAVAAAVRFVQAVIEKTA